MTINKKIFNNNKSTLKATSYYHDNGVDKFMTQSALVAIDFDGVKDEYVRDFNLIDKPKSNDAIFEAEGGEIYFIEFKSGEIFRKDLRIKIADSLLIFNDIIKKNISFTRQNVNYILVYNSDKLSSEEVINKDLADSAKQKYVCFNMIRFENVYFKEVFTYNEDEFKQNFVSKFST